MTDTTGQCVFCQILRGQATSYIVSENEHAVAILDIQPYARGHCLVIPRRHVPWWHDLTEKEVESLFKVARTVARKMVKEYGAEFICMYARGRRIPHTHIFLVPTVGGDVLDRFFNALEKVQESPHELVAHRKKAALRRTASQLRKRRG